MTRATPAGSDAPPTPCGHAFPTRICYACGEVFQPTNSVQRYCHSGCIAGEARRRVREQRREQRDAC